MKFALKSLRIFAPGSDFLYSLLGAKVVRVLFVSSLIAAYLLSPSFVVGDEPGEGIPGGGGAGAGVATANPGAAACPTGILAQIPQGGTQTLCLWQLTSCGTQQSAGSVNAACDADVCQCNGASCGGTGPAIQLGLAISLTDEATGATTRPRILNVNRLVPQRTIPVPTTLIPAAAASVIMPWGQGEWKVKYLKTLKVTETSADPNDVQYYGLYKVFKATAEDPNGLRDSETDQYVGFRVASEPAEPREVDTCSYNATDRVRKLQTTTSGVRMEIGVKAAVTAEDAMGTPSTLQKWFQVYGVYR